MSGLSWWHTGFLLWLTDSQVVAQGLSCPAASVAPTSPTRDQTHVHCVARQILNHWTTREVPLLLLWRFPSTAGKQHLLERFLCHWSNRDLPVSNFSRMVFFLFFSLACGILIPWLRIEPGPTAAKKQSCHFDDKGQYSQSYGFTSSHVQMWGTVKKAEHWQTDAFELWCWWRLLRVLWTARRLN